MEAIRQLSIAILAVGCLSEPALAVVKQSKNGIFHAENNVYFSRTKNFIPFQNLDACLALGGKLPNSELKDMSSRDTSSVSLSYSLLYDRSHWKHWVDVDKDCQDTRAEVLIQRSFIEVTFRTSQHCTVTNGTWFDPFSEKIWENAIDVDIDHVVPLKWANGHGGS